MIETMNWKPTKLVRSFFPVADSPKFPFSTKAGGKEVTYQAG